jgi:putative membrane protein
VAQPEPVGELGVVDGAHRSRAHSLRVGGDDRRDVAGQRRDLMETSMFYDGGWGWLMGGMHLLWWLFWIAVVAALVWVIRARPREPRPGEPAAPRETPLEVLQRRLASGDCTPEEYERRKALLDRDAPAGR